MRNQSVTNPPDAVFGALADPTRRAVLDLLRKGSLPAGQIAEVFPVSRPAISRHLQLLRRARLVEETRVSRRRIYTLNVAPLEAVDRWLSQYRAFWEMSLLSLKSVAESESARRPRRSKRR